MSQLQVSGEAKIRDIQGPVVANSGVITALDGAASQYVRGDGTLADFPTSSGGGSSVSYYLNSSVSQGTIGGVAYRELSKDPIIGAGTDIPISTNGYVANYITDANDPDVTIVPGGNFNCEFYFSVNNNTGNPNTYAELYKYDGTTFTLLGSSVGVPEYINQGTIIAPYYFAIPVATAALALTDRLAIRIYVNVDGRTVTLHTENGHLCQVVTTLSKGMVSLNNLTDQSQYLTTGTSGTNFAIVSSGDTHTFNLPVASATNTGKLSNTDWNTFNNKVPYTGATTNVDLGIYNIFSSFVYAEGAGGSTNGGILIKQYSGALASNSGYTSLFATPNQLGINFSGVYNTFLQSGTLTASRTYTLPDITGTLALLEGSQTFSGSKTFTQSPISEGGYSFKILASGTLFGNGYSVISSLAGNVSISQAISAGNLKSFTFDFSSWATNTFYTYALPASDGTIALTSNLSAYLPLTGGTLTGNLTINPSTTDYTLTVSTSSTNNTIKLLGSTASNTSTIGYWSSNGGTGYGALNFTPTNTRFEIVNGGSFSIYTSGNERLTIASTGAVNLGTNELTSGNAKINDTLYLKVATTYAHVSGYYGIQVGTNLFTINNSASTQAAFSLASLTTSRTFTLPDASGTLALTSQIPANPVTGTGTTNYLPKFTGASTIGNSALQDDGSSVLIGRETFITGTTAYFQVGNGGAGTGKFQIEASSGSAIIGTRDASSIAFRTNLITRMTLDTSGNLGLGVTPTYKLDVRGQGYFATASGTNQLTLGDTSNGTSSAFATSNNSLLFYADGSNEKMRLTNGGNLLVGFTAAYGKLSVNVDAAPPASSGNMINGVTIANTTGGRAINLGVNEAGAYNYIQSSYVNNADVGVALAFFTGASERMRISSGGFLLVGTTSNAGFGGVHRITNATSQGTGVLSVDGGNGQDFSTYFLCVSGGNNSAALAAQWVGRNTSTGRSINAGGTINASGADYAEYMTKAIEDDIAKGDIVGVDENGLLTNIFVNAKSFVVKSTDPSYVGGDTWGVKLEAEQLEAARAKVDRIAFSGQVPCNVYNANVGDYIIPIELNGKISGQAISNPTFEQYQISVGKVWKIMKDGRAWIAVKIG